MAFRGETMIVGRDFPIMQRAYDHPREHWSLEWILAGSLVATAVISFLLILLWLIR